MELRQLEAFIAVATELHFGRAAESLHISQPSLSELVRRLEREIGTPLLARTTRRVALTGAGAELLDRAKAIVHDVSAVTDSVRRVANGETGIVRLGIIPAAVSVLAPHVVDAMRRHAPDVTVDIRRMWPPDLLDAVADGVVDVAMTCGHVVDPPGVVGEVFCAEHVAVGLRTSHRLADRESVAWADLARESFGIPSPHLFPDWSSAQQRLIDNAGISPPVVELAVNEVSAAGWSKQSDVDWIMTSRALSEPDPETRLLPLSPPGLFTYKLQWNPARVQTAAAAQFVQLALTVDVPTDWVTQPGHLRARNH